MSYNKDENMTFEAPQEQGAQSQFQGGAADSPAAHGIRRFDLGGNASANAYGGGVNPAPNIWEAYKMFWQNYVKFDGRSRRSEFWWPTLINGVISTILYCIMMGSIDAPLSEISTMSSEQLAEILMKSGGYWASMGLGGLFGLATLLPHISLAVRRLHDLNINGWWYATMLLNCCGLVPLVFFILFCFDSKPGSNEWGVSPKYKQEE